MQNRIIGILGRKGSGKSCALRELVAEVPRLLIWDPMCEHGSLCPNRLDNLQRLVAFLHWSRGKSVWRAHYVPHGDLVEEFDLVAKWVYRYGRMVLAVEEVPMVCQPNWVPPGFDHIIRLGRHRRIDVVWTGQRAAEIARRLTAATDVFVLFAQTEARDLEALADRCGVEVAAQVSRLGLHDRLVWDVLNRVVRRGKLAEICFGPIEPPGRGSILTLIPERRTARCR
jgi:hypothetical protein